MHSDQLLGRYIDSRLRQIEMSRTAFAQELGRDRFYVHRVIKGQTLSPSYLPTVAKVLGVSVQNLMEPPNVNN
jgi:plasmid maintenance system antidote protein VapI